MKVRVAHQGADIDDWHPGRYDECPLCIPQLRPAFPLSLQYGVLVDQVRKGGDLETLGHISRQVWDDPRLDDEERATVLSFIMWAAARVRGAA